jgi:hypothetical protein
VVGAGREEGMRLALNQPAERVCAGASEVVPLRIIPKMRESEAFGSRRGGRFTTLAGTTAPFARVTIPAEPIKFREREPQ